MRATKKVEPAERVQWFAFFIGISKAGIDGYSQARVCLCCTSSPVIAVEYNTYVNEFWQAYSFLFHFHFKGQSALFLEEYFLLHFMPFFLYFHYHHQENVISPIWSVMSLQHVINYFYLSTPFVGDCTLYPKRTVQEWPFGSEPLCRNEVDPSYILITKWCDGCCWCTNASFKKGETWTTRLLSTRSKTTRGNYYSSRKGFLFSSTCN